jgi:hypothetical protein
VGSPYRRGGISRRDTLDAGPEPAREAIVSETPWTIDSIAHALPHPAVRMRFLSEINLAPVDQLQGVIDKWITVIDDWEAGRPRIEALREYALAHGGELPSEFVDDGTSGDFLAQLSASVHATDAA